ncbi:hypothetical protein CYL18_14340 [Pradoshia eiseniae]|uniref:DUF8208 domain-containing protein n=1 Tax=Pradoshia eiseniae TaxID=2064768 RepID=A0A2S7MX38_9BACI|nr:hypothetical protein [Pradoshia eiseniae]PQD94391.1 hypothetical protein CYL18_14340 [Pradoshia eiseniae]
MDEEVVRILEKFSDFLEITNPINYSLRLIGWTIINGLAWLVDALADITDSVLGLKSFFNHSDINDFIHMLLPLSAILMGFSLLYTGYRLIFQKKIDREVIVINIILLMFLFALLSEGMDKANKFTDEAIDALNITGDSSMSQEIIKDNLIDLAQFDAAGWQTTDLKNPNQIPEHRIQKIDITQTIDKDFTFANDDQQISEIGREVFDSRLGYDDMGNLQKVDLDNGWFTVLDEKYYRWGWNFWTIIVTLGITAFTLLTISIKLAKLFFELTFNYVLVTIIAPSDIHSGQKTKKILQSILNIFLTTFMIFLSMKIYIIGTSFITETLDGVAYLIALFAFSLAVIDGPNIVERLFGIDAGLKSGWGAIAGAYASTKGISKGIQGGISAGKSIALRSSDGKTQLSGHAHNSNERRLHNGKGETPLSTDNLKNKLPASNHTQIRGQHTGQNIDLPKDYLEVNKNSTPYTEQEPQLQEKKVDNQFPGLHQEMEAQNANVTHTPSNQIKDSNANAHPNIRNHEQSYNKTGFQISMDNDSSQSIIPRQDFASTKIKNIKKYHIKKSNRI